MQSTNHNIDSIELLRGLNKMCEYSRMTGFIACSNFLCTVVFLLRCLQLLANGLPNKILSF